MNKVKPRCLARLLVVILLVQVASHARAQLSDCASSTSASVADSSACGISLLHGMLHRNDNYHIDAASAEAVNKFISRLEQTTDYDSRTYFSDNIENGARMTFGVYRNEVAFIMPVMHRHYSYMSGGQYKCFGTLYITPTKVSFESTSDGDGFSFSRSELVESQYQVERGDDGRRILKIKAGSQTYIMAPDCFIGKSGHYPCSYSLPYILFDSAIQNFQVVSYTFAQHAQSLSTSSSDSSTPSSSSKPSDRVNTP